MPPGGYAWWYLDAVSDDGAEALTVIGFVGSVFSPYYALARRRGAADPEQHVAFNVCLYGRQPRWTMTERGRASLSRGPDHLAVGASRMQADADGLTLQIDERAVPVPRAVRGTVRVRLPRPLAREYRLDPDGRHLWRPIAPAARVEVEFETPRLRWTGSAYLDHNRGSEPLEAGFKSWCWSRGTGADTVITYSVVPRAAAARSFALAVDGGIAVLHPAPPDVPLRPTAWGIARPVTSEDGDRTRLIRTLEDTPFYARSLVETRLFGRSVTAVHEALSLDRFRRPIVQAMLPFRMPRRARWP